MGLAQRGEEPPDGWVADLPADDELAAEVAEQMRVPEQMRSGELLDGELTYG
jgi:hypothetical protein